MMEAKERGRGEKGSVMVVALMMLALLTLIGLTATRNSSVELQMVENDAAYRQALYNADSGISFGLRLSESDVDDLSPGDLIPGMPESSRFRLRYLRLIDEGPPMVIEIQSEVGPDIAPDKDSGLVNSKAAAKVVAGIQLPPPGDGQIEGPGDEFEYTN